MRTNTSKALARCTPCLGNHTLCSEYNAQSCVSPSATPDKVARQSMAAIGSQQKPLWAISVAIMYILWTVEALLWLAPYPIPVSRRLCRSIASTEDRTCWTWYSTGAWHRPGTHPYSSLQRKLEHVAVLRDAILGSGRCPMSHNPWLKYPCSEEHTTIPFIF